MTDEAQPRSPTPFGRGLGLRSGTWPEPNDSIPLLLFELEGQLFGVSVAQVEAISAIAEESAFDLAAAQVATVGEERAVSIESLAGWVGLAEPHTANDAAPWEPSSRLLLSRTAGGLRIFRVDTPRDVVHLPVEDVFPMPPMIRRVLGATPLWAVGRMPGLAGGGLVILVDLARRSRDGG